MPGFLGFTPVGSVSGLEAVEPALARELNVVRQST